MRPLRRTSSLRPTRPSSEYSPTNSSDSSPPRPRRRRLGVWADHGHSRSDGLAGLRAPVRAWLSGARPYTPPAFTPSPHRPTPCHPKTRELCCCPSVWARLHRGDPQHVIPRRLADRCGLPGCSDVRGGCQSSAATVTPLIALAGGIAATCRRERAGGEVPGPGSTAF